MQLANYFTIIKLNSSNDSVQSSIQYEVEILSLEIVSYAPAFRPLLIV